MNKIIVLCLITLSLAITDKGPAYNLKYPDSEKLCSEHYIYDYDDNGDHNILYWADENPGVSEKPNSESDCVDLLLWDETENKYYDRCCYVRLQLNGVMHSGCAMLTEEQYLDISETIRRIEEGDPRIIDRASANSKVYQLDCKSNFIKAITIASFLLAFVL